MKTKVSALHILSRRESALDAENNVFLTDFPLERSTCGCAASPTVIDALSITAGADVEVTSMQSRRFARAPYWEATSARVGCKNILPSK